MAKALDGIRVLDLCQNDPGQYAAAMLGDLGADVIHVQDPRPIADRANDNAASEYARFDADRRHPAYPFNRNKRGIAINLKTKAGNELFHRLIDRTDVVLEGFRPGVMTRLGLDYETLSRRNPRIIYCSISGYGQTGPYRDLVGHDVNYIATAGALAVTGPREGAPVLPGFQLGDFGGGTAFAVAGILLALFTRERTGRGQLVDVSMTDGALALLANLFSMSITRGAAPRRGADAINGGAAYYGVYECRDGKWLSLGTLEPRFWAELCRMLDREDLILAQDDSERVEELRSFLAERLRARSRDEWFNLFKEHNICVGRVLEIDELPHDPQLQARGMFVEVPAPDGRRYLQIGSPFKLSETPSSIRRCSPSLGQHTDEILAELGYTAADIGDLRASGAVR